MFFFLKRLLLGEMAGVTSSIPNVQKELRIITCMGLVTNAAAAHGHRAMKKFSGYNFFVVAYKT